MTGFTAADVPDQSGRTIIVTGANAGIGFETAKVLAARGARVLLGCRNAQKAEAAMAAIRQETPVADLAHLPLDQADLASVREAADLAMAEPRLDVLINNAGVYMVPLSRTKDGFEQQFGVNHLGTFALTSLLLPKLAETPGSRVVITASLAHRTGKLRWDDLNAVKHFARFDRYGASKLANMLHMAELDRRLRAIDSPVIVVGCHPGAAATNVPTGRAQNFRARLLGRVLNSPMEAAWPALQAATAPDAKPGGYYGPQSLKGVRGRSGPATRSASSLDRDLARRCWDVSAEMTGIDPGLAPV